MYVSKFCSNMTNVHTNFKLYTHANMSIILTYNSTAVMTIMQEARIELLICFHVNAVTVDMAHVLADCAVFEE